MCLTANALSVEVPAPTNTATAAPVGTSVPTATPIATPEITPVITPVVTPNVTPVVTPVITPVFTPIVTPVVTPVVTPNITPVATPTITPTATPATGSQSMTSLAAGVISQVNAERAKYGLQPLHVDANLMGAARIRAEEIVRNFSHTRPDGSSWSTVSEHALGENIAMGHNSVDRVMAAWLTSEGHRKNILRESFGSIGVCALKVNGVLYWVQLFGR